MDRAAAETMFDSLRGKVVVITGASSGIGRASAIEFARHGAHVALAARRKEALEETARLCKAAGGEPHVVVTDVTREADVQNLARSTTERLGPIDVWINNAGVTLFGLLAEASFEDHRRVIETNLFGAMYGARAVMPLFEERGRGVLIDVGSVLSRVGQPFVPSYVISKFAVHGLSEALRTEVAEHPDIHVCTLYPFVVDTPHFETGANLRRKRARGMPPVQAPERVARALVSLAVRPRREAYVPRYAELGVALHALAPQLTETLLLRSLRRWHFDDEDVRPTKGNLYEPAPRRDAHVHGRRPAQLGTLSFAVWVLRELIDIEVDAIRRAALRVFRGAAPRSLRRA